MKKQTGITLISLIITIIIMLILSGVALSAILGDDTSLLNTAITAKEETESESKAETELLELSSNFATDYANKKFSKIIKKGSNTLLIPWGFEVSQKDSEDSIEDGLVIYQIPTGSTVNWESDTIILKGSNTAINLQENVNQLVWIPVNNINDMIMCKQNGNSGTYCNLTYDSSTNEITCTTHNYSTSTPLNSSNINTTGLAGRIYSLADNATRISQEFKTDILFTETTKQSQSFLNTNQKREPSLVSTDNTAANLTLTGTSTPEAFLLQLNEDFIKMAKSVAKYGGFWVSRYELGTNLEFMKNKPVLGNLSWYGYYGKLKSHSLINKEHALSHMIWGCQYDQIVKFIGSEAQIGHSYQKVTKINTGTNTSDNLKNIIDLEGNHYEKTAAAIGTTYRNTRGASYGNSRYSNWYPAASFYKPDYSSTDVDSMCTSRLTICYY